MSDTLSAQNKPRQLFVPSDECPDLWHYLRKSYTSGRKIVMYGMGNGADKILDVCKRFGVEISDFFASDGFVRGHSFHGKQVLSYTDIKEKYGTDDVIILLSFATSRPEVLENIDNISSECELYAPDVPAFGDALFDFEFYTQNVEHIKSTRQLLCDNYSREVFDRIIEFKLSGRIDILRTSESLPGEAYSKILHVENFVNCADLGAYNGDSIRELLEFAPNLKNIIAFEPDQRNFRKLNEYAGNELRCTIHTVNAGAWSESGELEFDDSGNRNANLISNTSSILKSSHCDQKKKSRINNISVDTLDRVAKEFSLSALDYIKYDVEGSEARAITGSAFIIKNFAPSLLVSLYHRSEDIFALPLLITKMQPKYKFYLRRMTGIPAWDINLYAVTE